MLQDELTDNLAREGMESFIREVFDKLSVCIFLTDIHGKPVYTNQAANSFLESHYDRSCQTQLNPMQLDTHDSLLDCLRTLANKLMSDGMNELSVLYSSPETSAAFINGLQISPNGVKKVSVRLLFMLSPSTQSSTTPAQLTKIYGLTMAEHKVLQHFAKAHDLDKIAEDIGVGVNTVRAHLKSIYAKVGVTKQASLLDIIKRHPSTLFQM